METIKHAEREGITELGSGYSQRSPTIAESEVLLRIIHNVMVFLISSLSLLEAYL